MDAVDSWNLKHGLKLIECRRLLDHGYDKQFLIRLARPFIVRQPTIEISASPQSIERALAQGVKSRGFCELAHIGNAAASRHVNALGSNIEQPEEAVRIFRNPDDRRYVEGIGRTDQVGKLPIVQWFMFSIESHKIKSSHRGELHELRCWRGNCRTNNDLT